MGLVDANGPVQIFNSLCFHGINLKLVFSSSGFERIESKGLCRRFSLTSITLKIVGTFCVELFLVAEYLVEARYLLKINERIIFIDSRKGSGNFCIRFYTKIGRAQCTLPKIDIMGK